LFVFFNPFIMLSFTLVPSRYAPLGSEARYSVGCDTPATIELQITDAADGSLLGVKRFVDTTAASCDIAPYLRRAVRFSPAVGSSGFHDPAGRSVSVLVAASAAVGGSVVARATAPLRTFLATAAAASGPVLLTSMPRERLIAPDECDELTLFQTDPARVVVTATQGDTTVAESYRNEAGGLQLFRIDARDFPGAERLIVDAGACGTVAYTLLPAPQGSRRLAWRTARGSIEHYTFPVERSAAVVAGKRRVREAGGYAVAGVACGIRIRLESAVERREVLEALAGIVASPSVWEAVDGGYVPVDVLTDEAPLHRYGPPGSLTVEIRRIRKTPLPWN